MQYIFEILFVVGNPAKFLMGSLNYIFGTEGRRKRRFGELSLRISKILWEKTEQKFSTLMPFSSRILYVLKPNPIIQNCMFASCYDFLTLNSTFYRYVKFNLKAIKFEWPLKYSDWITVNDVGLDKGPANPSQVNWTRQTDCEAMISLQSEGLGKVALE